MKVSGAAGVLFMPFGEGHNETINGVIRAGVPLVTIDGDAPNSDRIAYAACIFPLTQRQDLSKSLGTRHRAAIGLSEETDAVVVVVSEETGAIGYAYQGELVRGVTSEALRAFLLRGFPEV